MDALASIVTFGSLAGGGAGPPAGAVTTVPDGTSRFAGMVSRAADARFGRGQGTSIESPSPVAGEKLLSDGVGAVAAGIVTAMAPVALTMDPGPTPNSEQQVLGELAGNIVGQALTSLRERTAQPGGLRDGSVKKGQEQQADRKHNGVAQQEIDQQDGAAITDLIPETPVLQQVAVGEDQQQGLFPREKRDASQLPTGGAAEIPAVPVMPLSLPVHGQQMSVGMPGTQQRGAATTQGFQDGTGGVRAWKSQGLEQVAPLVVEQGGTFAADNGRPPVMVAAAFDPGTTAADSLPRNPGATAVGHGSVLPAADLVLRSLPSGVTVVNPQQTAVRSNSPFIGTAQELTIEQVAMGRTERQQVAERGVVEQHGDLGGEAIQKPVAEASSLSGNTTSGNGAGSNGFTDQHSQDMAIAAERVERPAEVTTRSLDTDKARLQDTILSQVRERLATYEPSSTGSKITLKLNPGELGELQIRVQMQDQRMQVEIMAQNPAVKEVLLQNIDQLKDALARQNIAMERFDISDGQSTEQNFDQFFREGHQAAGQQHDGPFYSPAGYYTEEENVSPLFYGEHAENSLVNVRL
jgi:hypothetical protein